MNANNIFYQKYAIKYKESAKMKKELERITKYLDYLLESTRLFISVHFKESFYELVDVNVINTLIPYNSHNNPYCRFVRSDPDRYICCIKNQKLVMNALAGKESLEHTCFAHASELAYPIRKNDKVIGYATVSGYKGSNSVSFDEPLWASSLDSVSSIPKRLTDALIPPLCFMFEAFIADLEPKNPTEQTRILAYVSENYTTLTLDTLASRFRRSRSYMSHIFKKMTGKTLRAYCNDLKLFSASKLLTGTEMSVTEAALEAGFEDTSYFVKLFKEKYGQTPYKYKKSHLTTDLC